MIQTKAKPTTSQPHKKKDAPEGRPKGAKDGLAGKSFAQQEAALRPGGAADKARSPASPQVGGPHCDPLGQDSIEYEFLYDSAVKQGFDDFPALGAWMALKEAAKDRWRADLEGPANGGSDPLSLDAVEYEYLYDSAARLGLTDFPALGAWGALKPAAKDAWREKLEGPNTMSAAPAKAHAVE